MKTLQTFNRKKIINLCKFHWKDALTDLLGFVPKIYGFDPFRGCLHDCIYCWLRVLNKRFKNIKPDCDFTNLELCENVSQMLAKELPKLPENALIIACNSTDLFQPIIPKSRLLQKQLLIWINALYDYNVLFMTKNGSLLRDCLKNKKFKFNIEKHIVGVTVTTNIENEALRKRYELNSSSTSDRYSALDAADHSGLKKFVSIEPPLMNPRKITEEIIDCGLGHNTWFVWGFANYSVKSLWTQGDYLNFNNDLLALRKKYPYENHRSKFFWKDECQKQIKEWLELSNNSLECAEPTLGYNDDLGI